MHGRVCMITGASSGIGRATARALAQMGASVVLVCRNQTRGQDAISEIRAATENDALELMLADLASQESIRRLAAEFRERHGRLRVLINNAGLYLAKRSLTSDGPETTFAVNHLAYFLLTNLLLDLLEASAPARIVNVSSGAHQGARVHFDDLQGAQRYGGFSAYSRSKLANLLFTYELARRLDGTGVTVNCLHPGAVATGFARNNPGLYAWIFRLLRPFFKSPEKGAQTSIYLASSPDVEGVTGKYFVDCREARSSRESYDEAAARRLWAVSAELTGLPA